MAVEVIAPGYVYVSPDVLNWTDVLMTAKALIEEHGWVKGESGAVGRGWSLHGAIGEAASRLTGQEKGGTTARALRDESTVKVRDVMPATYRGDYQADITWNDKQRGAKTVVALIDRALATA